MLCFLLDKISSRFKCHFVILNEYALIKKYWQQGVSQNKHCVDVFDKLYFGFLICYHLYWIIKNGICGKTNKSIECRFVSTASTSCDKMQSLNINAIGAIAPSKTYKSYFICYNFVQFGKQHSRYKANLSSIILSQQCCEVCFISLTVAKLLRDLTPK